MWIASAENSFYLPAASCGLCSSPADDEVISSTSADKLLPKKYLPSSSFSPRHHDRSYSLLTGLFTSLISVHSRGAGWPVDVMDHQMDEDGIPITGLEELESHLQVLLHSPDTALDAERFDEVSLQLTGRLYMAGY